MTDKKANFLLKPQAFAFLAILYLISILGGGYDYQWLPKILPILLLVGLALRSRPSVPALFTLGLIFSLCGDVLLAIHQGELFVFGLGAFLLAHVVYILALRPFDWSYLTSRFKQLIAYGLFAGLVFSLLATRLGELFVPVLVYMLVLLMMAMATLVSGKSNFYLMLGGASFVLSDSMIGIDKFYTPLPYANVLIMTTYYLAQYCLLKGMLKSTPQFDGVTAAASSES